MTCNTYPYARMAAGMVAPGVRNVDRMAARVSHTPGDDASDIPEYHR